MTAPGAGNRLAGVPRRLLPCLWLPPIWMLTAALLAYSTGPDPRHTGGFGEETCTACHKSFELNSGRTLGGTFVIEGVPRQYQTGESYPLSVTISHPGQRRWGFQLTARFRASGAQAGLLIDDGLENRVTESGGLQYLHHIEAGTREGVSDGPVSFFFTWVAPAEDRGAVVFNAAGNAANGNHEPTGDFIYTAGAFSASPGGIEPATSRGAAAALTEVGAATPPARINESSRFLHIPAPVDLEKGDVEVHIEHRFLQGLDDAGPGNAFGIDSGANIQLGLTYALHDALSAGIFRTRFDKIVTLQGVWEIETRRQSPWKLSLVGGISGEDNFQERYSPFLQLASSFDVRRLRLYAVPTLALNTRPDELVELIPDVTNPDSNHTFSFGLGADYALNRNLSASFEYVPRLVGFGGFFEPNPALTFGFKIRSWGHVFSITASTSRNFTPGRYGVNNQPDFSLGFNVYRRIR